MAKKEKVFAFLDTNIFLEFQEFTQIDWPTITNSKSVCLVVTRINMQELDGFKYDPKSQRRQKRSRNVTKKILKILQKAEALEAQIPCRPGVSLLYLTASPDMSNHPELKESSNDDQMMASILDFINNNSEATKSNTVLIAADTGPQLLAMHYGLKTVSLGDEYQLEPEPNQIEKRLKQLENQLSERQPQAILEIEGDDGNGLVDIDQVKRNAQCELSLERPSNELITHVNKVKDLYTLSDKTRSDRTGGTLYQIAIPTLHRPLTIDKSITDQISTYLRKLDVNFALGWLKPIDVYTDNMFPPGYRATAKGKDADWYEALYELQDACEKDAESRFNAISRCTHFPIKLRIGNTGSVGMEKVSVEVKANNVYLSYILPQFETPESDRDKAAPAVRYLASDVKPQLYGHVQKLSRQFDLLRPKETEEITIGFIVVPKHEESCSLNICVRAANLPEPLNRQIEARFNAPVGNMEDEANFYKQLFE